MSQTEQKKMTPLYAVVGAGDLVVERIRLRRLALDSRLEQLQAVPDKAGDVYADLVSRGSRLVTRIRNQESTERLERRADTTARQAKSAATAVKNTTKTTRDRARATATSAARTAAQAKVAATDAAEKVGD